MIIFIYFTYLTLSSINDIIVAGNPEEKVRFEMPSHYIEITPLPDLSRSASPQLTVRDADKQRTSSTSKSSRKSSVRSKTPSPATPVNAVMTSRRIPRDCAPLPLDKAQTISQLTELVATVDAITGQGNLVPSAPPATPATKKSSSALLKACNTLDINKSKGTKTSAALVPAPLLPYHPNPSPPVSPKKKRRCSQNNFEQLVGNGQSLKPVVLPQLPLFPMPPPPFFMMPSMIPYPLAPFAFLPTNNMPNKLPMPYNQSPVTVKSEPDADMLCQKMSAKNATLSKESQTKNKGASVDLSGDMEPSSASKKDSLCRKDKDTCESHSALVIGTIKTITQKHPDMNDTKSVPLEDSRCSHRMSPKRSATVKQEKNVLVEHSNLLEEMLNLQQCNQGNMSLVSISSTYTVTVQQLETQRSHALLVCLNAEARQNVHDHYDKQRLKLVTDFMGRLSTMKRNGKLIAATSPTANVELSPSANSSLGSADNISCDTKLAAEEVSKAKHPAFGATTAAILDQWYQEYRNNPYPSNEDMFLLVQQTGLKPTQVRKWLCNRRLRDGNTKGMSQRVGNSEDSMFPTLMESVQSPNATCVLKNPSKI